MSTPTELRELHRKNRNKVLAAPIPAKAYDLRQSGDRSESVQDAGFKVEDPIDALVEDIERATAHGTSKATFAAPLFEASRRYELIGSLASARLFNEWKWRLAGETLRLLASHAGQPSCSATILNADWHFAEREIPSINFAKLKNQIKTHFKRSGISAASGFLVGGFDADYDGDLLRVHVHCVASGQKALILPRLRKLSCYQPSPQVLRPLMIKPIRSPRRQVSYCFKTHWRANVYFENSDGCLVKSIQRRRLPERIERACFQKLHETSISDLLVVSGVRLTSKGLKPTLGQTGRC